ncbi:MAG: carboxypeptidase-like regulatory domain-containing protein [Gemmatimonadaceae bacterium]|jgi:hypothetical protein|nr:carboxypeptidase-like regulatory domain-containing protein [Gemmatimonadaceae bacterium]
MSRTRATGLANVALRFAFVVTTGLVGCTSHRATRYGPAASQPSPALHIIYSDWLARERNVEQRETARRAVVVRSAERPLAPAGFTAVILTSRTNGTVRRVSPDSNGTALVDSLPAGRYRVVARRIGHITGSVEIELPKGCRVDLEMYMGWDVVGIDPPAPTPNRYIMTTCTPRVPR